MVTHGYPRPHIVVSMLARLLYGLRCARGLLFQGSVSQHSIPLVSDACSTTVHDHGTVQPQRVFEATFVLSRSGRRADTRVVVVLWPMHHCLQRHSVHSPVNLDDGSAQDIVQTLHGLCRPSNTAGIRRTRKRALTRAPARKAEG